MKEQTKNELTYLSFIQAKLSCLTVFSNQLPKEACDILNGMSKATYDRKAKVIGQAKSQKD